MHRYLLFFHFIRDEILEIKLSNLSLYQIVILMTIIEDRYVSLTISKINLKQMAE